MASKLCCIAEQDHRPDSPELPNARVSQITPAKRPLLTPNASSPNSRFTSARSEELHELRDIFHNARDSDEHRAVPMQALRPRFSRPSMHSLHNLHKMTSMRSILRRKLSRGPLNKAPLGPPVRSESKAQSIHVEHDTVIKQVNHGPNQQLQITKDDLRKHLLSDKKAHEGGYDSDAEMLDDIAKNLVKRSASKRPSIHSVDWTTSSGSKTTPESSTKDRTSIELKRHLHSYSIHKPQAVPLSHRLSQVFSTPNLRSDASGERDRTLRRSYSATSMGLPKPSPISPLRLPDLIAHDLAGVPWSEIMHESLRLSQFPAPPRHISPKASITTLGTAKHAQDDRSRHHHQKSAATFSSHQAPYAATPLSARTIEIRVQQPTSLATPRASTSIRAGYHENAQLTKHSQLEEAKAEDEDDNPRRSVHLTSMRISHHLRSGSLLSWDQLVDVPQLPNPPRPFRERTVSDQSRISHRNPQSARHDRQTSSSGFASSKVPSRWGKVVPSDRDIRPDVASSIYSSRPQSPPDSHGGSMVTLSRTGTENQPFSISSVDLRKLRHSNSFPPDNEDPQKPVQRYGVANVTTAKDPTVGTSLLSAPTQLARKNSVADTKTSKFREEFSPSPPKKKLTQSSSIIKFLNPKRLSLRSQSEATLQPDTSRLAMDGVSDTLAVPADRERRQSRSLMSLQAEQEALGKNKGANPVWDRALQAHQNEKASLFLPQNKELAVHASPFRERSGSVSIRRTSVEDLDPTSRADRSSRRLSTPVMDPQTPGNERFEEPSTLISRRSALAGRDDVSLRQEVATAFEKQGDSQEVVGAWGRYPSHTRPERTLSAGKADRVQPRDFALEAAIKFASAKDGGHDDDLIDPTQRLPSPPLLPGEKKAKKKIGSGRVHKSNSMTFGKTLMKNYTKMFKSQSTEFRRHGRGHRSSVASGGILEHPELELLSHVWAGDFVKEGNAGEQDTGNEQSAQDDHGISVVKGKGKLRADDSMATLRPRRNSSAPNLNEMSFRDGTADSVHAHDRARVWSVYYENCVVSFPRLSTDANLALEEFGGSARLSFDSKRASMHSRTMPARLRRHSRNFSNASRGKSFISTAEDDPAGEEKSLVSVRRSTMDLISKFKEQEATEHEKILALTSMGGGREREMERESLMVQ
ncbi:hypothetical protein BDW02DRAFT_383056 [Decorospora gaudefroyi]|uniref:Uncharacterized protein n=1 Tax=Decorospora gaudefroyi TaxID=184978 RepID=A0A6A5K9T2_9PLEO|nr:hypothetical protein BDW02DRAFT_383056 [Decorospora gaudefroyi]